ncbi:hypothetical protein [Treponema sp.]|uniref:hypothetical protein n=1 Tax=Treponema sp. TaxID=166 RepID=UPI0025D32914|nr:hypothetical protein [Treponema sp.]MCR5219347.1 hypothetical protein [Treponema sp.]
MKKILSSLAILFALTTGPVFADNFIQAGIGVGTNYSVVEDNHDISFCLDGFYFGYKGFHTIAVYEDTDDQGNKEVNENYDTYIPSLFLGFHGDAFYITAGGNLIHYIMADYSSNFKIPFCYPTLSLGWDIEIVESYPNSGILNLDLSWYYCDMGDTWSQFAKSAFMFVPKFSVGFKYRYNF